MPLALVRQQNAGFDTAEMRQLADSMLVLVRDFYVHLPVKTSALAIDPVQELVLLGDDVEFGLDERTFLQRLLTTVKRLRDRHTSLRLPYPWTTAVAFLPFVVESCWVDGRQVLLVTKLLAELDDPYFRPGVTISHWNGVPIETCVRRFADTTAGANPWARVAVALRSLTVRPLAYELPPDEDWVTVTFDSSRGPRSTVLPWRLYFPAATSTAAAPAIEISSAGLALGVDRPIEAVNQVWLDLFSGAETVRRAQLPVPALPAVLATVVTIGGRSVGYLRIFNFDAPDLAGYLDAFADVLAELPEQGLIIDVRANPGGSIPAAEGLLQLLTDRTVLPSRLEFRVTNPLQSLVNTSDYFSVWRRSMSLRYETGQLFTQGFTLLDPALVARHRGVYRGPVVLVCDALAYSATDFFAAGFQDNGIGPVIGLDPVSGAGGGNVWTYAQLQELATRTNVQLRPLPHGTDVNCSLRRSTRVLFNEGLPLEGLGVMADIGYRPTAGDVLADNGDLVAFAAQVLATL